MTIKVRHDDFMTHLLDYIAILAIFLLFLFIRRLDSFLQYLLQVL